MIVDTRRDTTRFRRPHMPPLVKVGRADDRADERAFTDLLVALRMLRGVDGVATVANLPKYDVRLAQAGEEDAICDICRQGFAVSSEGLLSPETIERQVHSYYNPERVRSEITSTADTPQWQGYVVAVSHVGEVLGAAGGGVTDGTVGNIYVLYLKLALRGNGIGTALLDFVTTQQRSAGAAEQWVSVTEGNDLGIPFYRARGFAVRGRVPYIVADDGTSEAHSLRMGRVI